MDSKGESDHSGDEADISGFITALISAGGGLILSILLCMIYNSWASKCFHKIFNKEAARSDHNDDTTDQDEMHNTAVSVGFQNSGFQPMPSSVQDLPNAA